MAQADRCITAATGALFDTVPLVANGSIGADYHIPFPVVARASFGFYFSRFAITVRLITALFWHGMLSYVVIKSVNLTL